MRLHWLLAGGAFAACGIPAQATLYDFALVGGGSASTEFGFTLPLIRYRISSPVTDRSSRSTTSLICRGVAAPAPVREAFTLHRRQWAGRGRGDA